MSDYRNLQVFISSRMDELADEREAVASALTDLNIQAWKFESSAGARPQTIRETYLEELAAADLYIGLFWKSFGEFTIDEFREAQKLEIPCLVYEKRTELEEREPKLHDFLNEINSVDKGVTIQWFENTDELKAYVKRDMAFWQASSSRKGREAEFKEIQNRQRKQFRTRTLLLLGILSSLVLAVIIFNGNRNGRRCIQDQQIAQDGFVHIFEAHYDGGEIRWWLQQPREKFYTFADSQDLSFSEEKIGKYILSVQYDPIREYIWVGTSGRGLIRLIKQGSSGDWVFDKKFDQNDKLVDCQINTILVTGERIYLGAMDASEPVLNFSNDGESWSKTKSAYKVQIGQTFHTFTSLAAEGEIIWAGTPNGLFRLDGEGWSGPFEPNSENDHESTSLNVLDIAVGWGNIKWVATKNKGLLLMQNIPGTANWLNDPKGLGVDTVYAIDLFTSGKKALVGTEHGLFVCNLNESDPIEVDCEVINHVKIQQNPVFSLLLAPDDSSARVGTNNDENIPLHPSDWGQ